MPFDLIPERPSRAVSILVSVALVVLWGWIRLVLFDTTVFPLTYVLPLLIGVWTRDKVAVWCMAGGRARRRGTGRRRSRRCRWPRSRVHPPRKGGLTLG